MAETESIEELKRQLRQERQKIEILLRKIAMYEENGPAKLYYSLNRKSWEMADLLNKNNLTELDITEAKDKSFDRLKVVWNDASDLAIAIQTLGNAAGITGDEDADVKKKRTRTTPEAIAEEMGDYKKVDV